MAQEFRIRVLQRPDAAKSSMEFLSTGLRNDRHQRERERRALVRNEFPEHMAQECGLMADNTIESGDPQ